MKLLLNMTGITIRAETDQDRVYLASIAKAGTSTFVYTDKTERGVFEIRLVGVEASDTTGVADGTD